VADRKLLRELTEAFGPSGFETESANIVARELAQAGEVSRDGLGSVVCRVAGGTERPRIMVSAHLDEVGFMVKSITADGYVRFLPNTRLRDWVIGLAEKKKIRYHLTTVRGGYDMGAIHVHRSGVPSLAIGWPTRYIHAHTGIVSAADHGLRRDRETADRRHREPRCGGQ